MRTPLRAGPKGRGVRGEREERGERREGREKRGEREEGRERAFGTTLLGKPRFREGLKSKEKP
jgi:hypothetical protein